MELEDLITIATPEGVELRLRLAGLGSRFIAGVTDLGIMAILTVLLVVVTGGPAAANGFVEALFFVGVFAIWFLFPMFFEVLSRGRTPGKRWTHLRVVREDGSPVDLPASAVRNLMRLVDGLLLLYIPTVVGIAVTKRNQRPGDVAAGTLVIRDGPTAAAPAPRAAEPPATAPPQGRSVPAFAELGGAGWDVSAVTAEELAVVRRFLERRDGLDPAARDQLARRLSHGLRAKVAGAPAELRPEPFLEQLAEIKASRR